MPKRSAQVKSRKRNITGSLQPVEHSFNAARFFSLSSSLLCIAGFDGYFKYLSPAWELVLGHSLEDLFSTPYMAYVHPDDIQKTRAEAKRLAKHELETARFINRYRCKNGEYKWIEWNVTPEKDTHLLYCVAHDITTLKTAEEKYRMLAKQLELSIQKEADSLRREYAELKSSLKERYRFGNIIGKSPAMQEIYELIMEAGKTDSPVMIFGESGTGKEEVARTIHNLSNRRHNGFVPVNCGAIPELLFESEFFGYKKGAFTGAYLNKHGFFDLSHQGTLFLDEVCELNLNMQVKLLRALENGEYTPVGDNVSRHADIRLISATNMDIIHQVKKKQMREDFYYRVHVIPILLPPLRRRKEDIPLLAEYFLEKYQGPKRDLKFSGKEMDRLCDYSWPGNIRELQNVVQRYIVSKHLDYLDTGISIQKREDFGDIEMSDTWNFRSAIQYHERRIIIQALEKNRWHKEKTASMLGLPKRTFFRKLDKLGLKEA